MTLQTSLDCSACRYDLRGLQLDGLCPECGASIAKSIAATYTIAPLRLPSWLRIARSAYLAAAATLVLAPWLLPIIANQLGMPVVLGRKALFHDAMFACCVPSAVFGIIVGTLLIGHGSRWGAPVLASAGFLLVFALPGMLAR